jgi:hypothetical protein
MRFGPLNPQVFEADVFFKRILTAEEFNSILFMHKYAKEFEIDYEKMASGFESQMKKGEMEQMALFYQLIDRTPEIRGFKECLRRATGWKYVMLEVQVVLQAFTIWKTIEEFLNQTNISAKVEGEGNKPKLFAIPLQ